MTRILAIALPILILGVLGFGGVQLLASLAPEPEKSEEGPRALTVFAEPITRTNLELVVNAQGEVRAPREITVAPPIGGRLDYLSPDFVDGGLIRRGQLLAQIEKDDFELAVVRARSTVAAAEQALAREIAEADVARQDLLNLGVENASPLARREPQLAEARAALASAEAQLADAQLALSRTDIRAPFDGLVRTKDVDLGQFVIAGQSLGRIFATDVVEVALPLSDDELGRLNLPLAFNETVERRGPNVVFRANVAGEPRAWRGRVTRTAAALSSQSRLINVFGVVEDPYGAGADGDAPMAPGLFVTAEIEGDVIENVIRAPRAALRGDNRLFIGDKTAGTLSIREIDVIYTDENGVYFAEGAEPGELAIVSPIQAAFDGMTLNVVERDASGQIIEEAAEGAVVAGQVSGGEGAAQ